VTIPFSLGPFHFPLNPFHFPLGPFHFPLGPFHFPIPFALFRSHLCRSPFSFRRHPFTLGVLP
jgi:hypothetical protein